MSNSKPISRRTLFRVATTALLGAVSSPVFSTGKQIKGLTPAQTEGPFYPKKEQADTDLDLTRIKGHNKSAQGDVIEVSGKVFDRQGNPVSNALVEIWQANKWGRYNHNRDPNKTPIDDDFQGWGRIKTDKLGFYRFKTIMPGSYPASPIWTRPPHIHFKVWIQEVLALTTQMYFAGNKLNADDKILNQLSFEERSRLIVELEDSDNKEGDNVPKYTFDIIVQPTGFA